MKATIHRPWFRVGVDGGDVLTWEGWLSLAAVCGVLAVIWRTTSALPDLQRFGLAGGVVVVAGWLMRLRSVDITEDEDHGRQPWTYWAPLVTAFALIVALNLVPGLDESARIALTGVALVPTALVKHLIERWKSRR
jgi:hypothetical protein